MMPGTNLERRGFVLLRLHDRRFAVAADEIAELIASSRVFRFPHRTKEIEGIIVHRGHPLAVCDIAEQLLGANLDSRKFYLIARVGDETHREFLAFPVTGDCELILTEMSAPSETDATHVAGWLSHNGEVVEVLNLNALIASPEPRMTGMADAAMQEAHP